MQITFPASPNTNDTHTEGSITYKWDGAKWIGIGVSPADRLVEGSNSLEITAGNDLVWTGDEVGIGTNPTEKLDVLGNIKVRQPAGTDALIRINEATTNNAFNIKQTATEALIQTTASQPLNIRAQVGSGSTSYLAFWTRDDERLRITPGGALQFSDVNSPNDQNTDVWVADDVLNFNAFGTNGAFKFKSGSSSTERLSIASDGEVLINGDGSSTGYLRVKKDRDTAYDPAGGNGQDLIVQQISDATNTGGYSSLALQCNYTGQTGAWVAINAVRTGVGEADLTINPRNNVTGDVEKVRITSTGTIQSVYGIQSGGNATGGFKLNSQYSGKGYDIATQYATAANGGSSGTDPMFSGWWGANNTLRINTNGMIIAKGGINTQTGTLYNPTNAGNKVNSISQTLVGSGTFQGGFVSKNHAYEEYAFKWTGITSTNTFKITGPSYFMCDIEYRANQSNSSNAGDSIHRVTKGVFANNYIEHTWTQEYQTGNCWSINNGGVFTATNVAGGSGDTNQQNGMLKIVETYSGSGSYQGSTIVIKVYYCSGNLAIDLTQT